MLVGIALAVGPGDHGSRLDRFLRAALSRIPPRSVRFAIEAGEVRVDGETARKGRLLREGERVTVRRIAEADDWLPEPGDLSGAAVVFADDIVAVLEKPQDVHTEPHRPREEGTLAGYLRWKFPHTVGLSPLPGLSLLTRLDHATSGVVPAALTPDAFGFLCRQREKGQIRKTYVCEVAGRLEEAMTLRFRIDGEGGETVRVKTDVRDPDPGRWTVVTPLTWRGSVTVVRAEIRRGKRHQIRAHLAAAGFPIVGDRRYAAVPAEGPGRRRLMLHAAQVTFVHPRSREPMTVSSVLPAEFRAI